MKMCTFKFHKDEADSCLRYRGVTKEDWMNSNSVLVMLAVLSALLRYFPLFFLIKNLHMPQSHAWTCHYVKPVGVGFESQLLFGAVTVIKQNIVSSGRHTVHVNGLF